MNYNITFKFSDIQELKKIYKELLKSKSVTMSEVAERLGFTTPQQLTNLFNKKSISLDELNRLLDVIGCDFEITFKNR